MRTIIFRKFRFCAKSRSECLSIGFSSQSPYSIVLSQNMLLNAIRLISCHCTYVFSKQSVSNAHLSRFLDLSPNVSALNKLHLSKFIFMFQKLDFPLFALGDNYSILLWGTSFLFNITICVSGGSEGKESACNAGDLSSVPELRRSLGEGNGYLLQYSCLENSMDRGACLATVHGVAKSWTQLSD